MGIQAGAGPVARSRDGTTQGQSLFLLLIVIVPFMSAPAIAGHIINIPGFRIPNLVAGAAFLAYLAGGLAWPRDRLGRNALLAFLLYGAFFAIDFARSLPHLSIMHGRLPDAFPANPREYALSMFVGPLLFAASSVYVLTRLHRPEGISLVVRANGASLFVLSSAIIAMVAFNPDAFLSANRMAMLDMTSSVFGMHYNALGTVFTFCAPLLLFLAIKRGGFWVATFCLALVAVLLLKSRTALLTFAGISALTLVVLGRARVLALATPAVLIGVLLTVGPVLEDLLSQGFTQKSGISLWGLLSGREQGVWMPLIFEWSSNSYRFFFGEGLYGIFTSNILYSGAFFAAGQAHNLYIEFFLDNGVVLTALFLVGVAAWIVWGARLGRRIHSQLYWVLYLCTIAFLLTGITGRRFLPDAENLMMFPIIATLINVARLRLAEMRKGGVTSRSAQTPA